MKMGGEGRGRGPNNKGAGRYQTTSRERGGAMNAEGHEPVGPEFDPR